MVEIFAGWSIQDDVYTAGLHIDGKAVDIAGMRFDSIDDASDQLSTLAEKLMADGKF